MEKRFSQVKGSAQDPYEVELIGLSETNLSAHCTCPAGMNWRYCKHRFGIIEGSTKGTVGDNLDDVAVVKSWVPGTDIDLAMQQVKAIVKEAEDNYANLQNNQRPQSGKITPRS